MARPKIIDKARAILTNDDPERLAKRREIRERLAKLQAVEQECQSIKQQIKVFNEREDQAVLEHAKATAPLQEKLKEIEQQVASAILENEEVSDSIAQERLEALNLIAVENSRLESQTDVLRRLRATANERLRGLQPVLAQIPQVRSELTKFGVASTELLQQRFCAEQRRLHAQNRVAAADRELQRAASAVSRQVRERESHDVKDSTGKVVREAQPTEHELRLERQADNWQAELLAAQRELAAAERAVEAIRKQIVEE